jgi:transposase
VLSVALEAAWPLADAIGGKRSRRSWSAEEKQRIVAEAVVPGASVAAIARRHGVNANLVFTWRRAAQAISPAAGLSASARRLQRPPSLPANEPCEFIPIGVFGRADDCQTAVIAGASSTEVTGTSSHGTPPPRPSLDARPGVIEIDLADGARLRVDGLVNERALRRVLSALKATS